MILISFLIIFSYILYIVINYGIPHSLSETYYKTKVFHLVLISSTLLIFPTMLSVSTLEFLPFIVCTCLLFVAFTPDYMLDKLKDSVHTYNAIISLIVSLIWVVTINYWILLVWILLIVYIICKRKYIKTLFKDTNIIFWSEVLMLVSIYLVLIF